MAIQGFLKFAQKSKNIEEIQSFIDKVQELTKAVEHHINFTKDYQDLGIKLPKWLNLSDMITIVNNSAIDIVNETKNIWIFADPLFEKVLYNLIDNTIRHGVTATMIHVSVNAIEENIQIIWADNGVGVPAGEKEAIFSQGF